MNFKKVIFYRNFFINFINLSFLKYLQMVNESDYNSLNGKIIIIQAAY